MNLINKKAKNIIQQLLILDRCNNNIGDLVHDLLELTWTSEFDFNIIENYFKIAKHYGHFRDISFIISESKFNKDKNIFFILKKLVILHDVQILQDILVYYLLQINTKNDMKIYIDLLKHPNINIVSVAIYKLLYLDEKTIIKLIELNTNNIDIDLNILRQSNSFFKNIKLKKNKLYNMLLLIAMKRKKIEDIYIKKLVLESKDVDLYDLYYSGLCLYSK